MVLNMSWIPTIASYAAMAVVSALAGSAWSMGDLIGFIIMIIFALLFLYLAVESVGKREP